MTKLAFGCVLLFATAARAGTVGNPADPTALPAAVQAAYAAGERTITITPGTYAVPATATADALLFDGWHDATVVAAGATIVSADYRHRPVRFRHCSKVALTGATLRFAVPAYAQGKIAATGADAEGPWLDWTVDAGYPDDPATLDQTYNLIDAGTRLIKVGATDIGAKSRTSTGPGRFRLRFAKAIPAHAAVGDWLVCRNKAGTTLVHFDDSEGCTARQLNLENGGFAAVFETGGGGANTLVNCRVGPGPTPAGAAERQLVGCGADGFHSVNARVGPTVRDCTFEGVFLDDCIAVHGTFGTVAAVAGRDVTFDPKGSGGAAVGEPLRFSDTHGFFAEATVTAVDHPPGKPTRVTLDRDPAVPVGAKGNNPGRCGRGFQILNTRLGDTRSRGILVKADDGLIDGCTIAGCVMSGVSAGPEYYWNEANYVRHLTVRNCTFDHCGQMGSDQAAVWVHGDGAIGNRDVTIVDNRFMTGPAKSLVHLEWVAGVTVDGNTFAADGPMPPGAAAVRLAHCRDVKLTGNRFDAALSAVRLVTGSDVIDTADGGR